MPPSAFSGGLVARLSRSFQIEPEERRPTLLLAAFLMLGMATVICLKAVADSLFLSEFVTGSRWAHLDIAGPSFVEKTWRHFSPGGTGAMVPTMVRWIASL